MKILIAAIALAVVSTSAYAVRAFLVDCRTGTSVTGRFIYIGTYDYAGNRFERTFTSYCPPSVEVQ